MYGLSTKVSNRDVYKTDDGGGDTSWSALTAVLEDVTVTEISTNIFTRGSNTVHGAVYDDAGTVKYNELVL